MNENEGAGPFVVSPWASSGQACRTMNSPSPPMADQGERIKANFRPDCVGGPAVYVPGDRKGGE